MHPRPKYAFKFSFFFHNFTTPTLYIIVIPRAILFFTGEAVEEDEAYDDYGEDEEDEDVNVAKIFSLYIKLYFRSTG